jgi:excisionase family DNA binding protein
MTRSTFNPDDQATWPVILTAPQISKILQMSHTKIYQLLKQGTFPCLTVGRSIRVPRIGFLRWMENGTRAVAGETDHA